MARQGAAHVRVHISVSQLQTAGVQVRVLAGRRTPSLRAALVTQSCPRSLLNKQLDN